MPTHARSQPDEVRAVLCACFACCALDDLHGLRLQEPATLDRAGRNRRSPALAALRAIEAIRRQSRGSRERQRRERGP
jgi:hypothetical protein